MPVAMFRLCTGCNYDDRNLFQNEFTHQWFTVSERKEAVIVFYLYFSERMLTFAIVWYLLASFAVCDAESEIEIPAPPDGI